ncbi:hypothetical protein GCM10007423_52500 [Dyadobacter endophyticus]|uniref:Lipoprotein n=1 Tax=Dyadobacter endophyticus TaxID=1749036 RepID=A0ABQ1Z7L1_9BACT|nr:hypothetical protein [Dyadobacter endophyticus]GGH50065.1 hypothetical protein GCM10007423_52500 [Dyadobacter endophyticus]
MKTTSNTFKKNLLTTLGAVLLLVGITSCEADKADPKPLAFETGPVVFLPLGGVIESFGIVIDDLGSKPIEEYGIVYVIDSIEITKDPLITDKKVVFTEPAKVGGVRQEVKIGYPVGTTCISCRAYAKFKDGTVQYAEKGQKMIF